MKMCSRFRLKDSYRLGALGCVLLLCACQAGQLPKDPEKSVMVRTQLAAEYIRKGDLDAAKRSLDMALEVDNKDPAANMMMGILLQQEGSTLNLQKADQYFRRAITHSKDNAQARNNYGTYLFQMGRYEEAAEQLSLAAATLGYDQRARAAENLGRTYLKLGQMEQAEAAFKRALSADRDSSIAQLELAEMLYLRGDMHAARELYSQYVGQLGLNQLGARALWLGVRVWRAHADSLRMQQAVNALRGQFPDSPEYLRYLQLKESPEAIWK